jgi:16S rRNA (guanine966-N2)-methyltransferase
MPRIVGGTVGGRRIAAPRGRDVRPTADRVREAMFSTLTSLRGGLDGARVLDLYAGSGALGLEALSRGAEHALLVESAPAVARVLRANVAALGLAGASVLARSVKGLAGGAAPGAAYDVVVADPPYALAAPVVAAVLGALIREGWVATGALLVVERAGRDGAAPWPEQVSGIDRRTYGDTVLWYGRRA